MKCKFSKSRKKNKNKGAVRLLISNKDLLISKKETLKYTGSIQGYTIKYRSYVNQVNQELERKIGFSMLTSPIRFLKRIT